MNFPRMTCTKRRRAIAGPVFRRLVAASATAVFAIIFFAGCGPDRYVVLNLPPGSDTVTGNWQITATTTTGTAPFTALSGSVLENGAPGGAQIPLFAILQAVNPDSCFQGATTLPLEGNITGSSFSLVSLSDSGQFLNLSGTGASTNNSLTGSFLINDGCANGVQGTISGTKISPLTGAYSGPWTVGTSAAGSTLSLTLTQDSFADGFGDFHVQGTATFSGGPACFTAGTVQSTQSTISGEQVQLTITTNETTPSTVTMSGTVNPAANLLTLTSIQVLSGSCQGSAGTASLTS